MNRYASVIFAGLGVLFGLLMFLPLSLIPGDWAEYDQEPEDFYLSIFWTVLFALLCLAWFTSFIAVNKKVSKVKIFGFILSGLLVLIGTFLLLASVISINSALGIGVGVFAIFSGVILVLSISENKHVI